ncbi:MAG: hypothetical protein ABIR59_01795 [Gemmatimonadales bacterium]
MIHRLLVALVVIGLPTTAIAQDSAGVRPGRLPARAVAPTRPAPLNYFLRSLAVPGWGQASLNRKLTGGMFIAFEGLALAMAFKASHELAYLEATNSERVEGKRQERQDWFVLVAVNHLFSGLEAYVAANLYDFPADLRMRALPNGRTGVQLTMPMPHQ